MARREGGEGRWGRREGEGGGMAGGGGAAGGGAVREWRGCGETAREKVRRGGRCGGCEGVAGRVAR